jgi:hypothetical protein
MAVCCVSRLSVRRLRNQVAPTGRRPAGALSRSNLCYREPCPSACPLARVPLFATALSFLSSRAYADFLLHSSYQLLLMWFSLKRTTRIRPEPPLLTGNPGKPRDLQFRGPGRYRRGAVAASLSLIIPLLSADFAQDALALFNWRRTKGKAPYIGGPIFLTCDTMRAVRRPNLQAGE